MEKKVILEKVGEITNGGVFDCIGRDKNYAPVVYFKRCMGSVDDKNRVIDALASYFDVYTPHLVRVSPFLDEAAERSASLKIQEIALKEAEVFYDSITLVLGDYKFSWLPVIKKV